jgi:hypothetical protein
MHPDCDASAPWEDYLLLHSDSLNEYIASISGHWSPKWGVEGESLYRNLGDGLISFLAAQIGEKRLVTKTPSVYNLRYFFKFFPDAYLLVVVRDGRAVVESGVKTFGWDYEMAVRNWAEGARTILHFDQANKNSNSRYLLVKYEELYSNPQAELIRIFNFLELDVEAYDFEAAVNLPVRGSSAFRGQDPTNVHWKPVEKTADFNPLLRWSHWDRALHERFNWLAGQYLVQLGYEEKRFPSNRTLWVAWNKMLDHKSRTKLVVRRLKRAFK